MVDVTVRETGETGAGFSRTATSGRSSSPGDCHQRMATRTLLCATIPGLDSRLGRRGRSSWRSAPQGNGADFKRFPFGARPTVNLLPFLVRRQPGLAVQQDVPLNGHLVTLDSASDLAQQHDALFGRIFLPL